MVRINYTNVSAFGLADIICHLMVGNEVSLNYTNKDKLTVYIGGGEYAHIGSVKHLTITYAEHTVVSEGHDAWYAMNTEYFGLHDYTAAAEAFMQRATNQPHKATNTGKTLEELATKVAATVVADDPLEEASHALICGTGSEFEADEGHCNHCHEPWSQCMCDGGIGRPTDE